MPARSVARLRSTSSLEASRMPNASPCGGEERRGLLFRRAGDRGDKIPGLARGQAQEAGDSRRGMDADAARGADAHAQARDGLALGLGSCLGPRRPSPGRRAQRTRQTSANRIEALRWVMNPSWPGRGEPWSNAFLASRERSPGAKRLFEAGLIVLGGGDDITSLADGSIGSSHIVMRRPASPSRAGASPSPALSFGGACWTARAA